MSSLGVVSDFITNFHLNPLRNGLILFLFLGQELPDPESLVRRHGEEESTTCTTMEEKQSKQSHFKMELLLPCQRNCLVNLMS